MGHSLFLIIRALYFCITPILTSNSRLEQIIVQNPYKRQRIFVFLRILAYY